MKIAGYLIQEELYQGKRFSIYRAIEEKSSTPCIIKALGKKTARSSSILDGIKQEFHFLRGIDSEYVIKALDWIEDKDYAAIVLEDINGKSLKEEIGGKPTPIEYFIPLAVRVSRGLAAIHSTGVIHRDINPTNIIRGPGESVLKIIDFNIASKFDIKVAYSGNPEELQGTLPYISPEQTGRMNRRVDHRTDFYSLGATFYEMLTGQPPFAGHNPMEIVYDHLARDPEPLHLLDPRIPTVLSKIVLKLLAKNPEERYQSAEGLIHDLEKYRDPATHDFILGENDFSGKLQIPGKLYGREHEIRRLLEAYRGVGRGEREMIIVAGYSGVGKTTLVNEIHKPITGDKGFFISGKFDRFQGTIPYSAFCGAVNQFCQLLMTEKQEILDQWKNRISQAVGTSGKLLTDMIPLLESIIGPQPEIPDVGGEESKKRFNYVFQRFMQAISEEDHPVVLFIDDMQWADPSSLGLLQSLMEARQIRYLLFIGSYRDNEVSPTHPLMMILREMEEQGVTVHTIPVKNLTWENVREWLNDTLKTGASAAPEDLAPLTDLIYRKTQGNAFFTIQFLENLYKENLLRFDFNRSRWIWDIAEIEKQNITDNVVDLLIRKIQNLPVEVREALKLAACIGNRFDLYVLSIISKTSGDDIGRILETAVIQQMVYPLENGVYKFVHDRIHQAAYSLVPEESKKDLRIKIGRLALNDYNVARRAALGAQNPESSLFDIVNHLNTGIDRLGTREEKLELTQLNLDVARNARRSGAYKLGSDYIFKAKQLLPGNSWRDYYDLTLSVYNESAQAGYLCADFEKMENDIETILTQAHTVSDTSLAYEHRILGLVARNQPRRAVETLLSILNSIGVNIPIKPGKIQTRWTQHKTLFTLKRKGIESLNDLPMMSDPRKQLAIKLIYVGNTAIIWAGQDVFPYIMSETIRFILKDGLTPEGLYILCAYASRRLLLGDIPGAYRLAEIIMDLSEKRIHSESIRALVIAILPLSILGHKQHFKDVSRIMIENYRSAMNLGNFDLAAHILTNYLLFLSRTDMELPILLKKAETAREAIMQLKQSILLCSILIELAYCMSLTGKNPNPAVLDMDLDSLFEPFQKDTKKVFVCQANIKRVILAYLFDDYSNILEYIKIVEESWSRITSPLTFMRSDIYFYIPLAYIKLSEITSNKKEKEAFLGKARERMKTMKEWAEFGPVNFLHKYYLTQAELSRVEGAAQKAAEYYDKAISKAYENEYINEAALANELAAKFYMESGRHKLATVYFQEARDCYRKWGAKAKIKFLEEKFPKYMNVSPGYNIPFSTDAIGESLDIKSILKASQTLSREVQLKNLLEKMTHILIENAGAQKCLLMENTADGLLIQAEGSAGGVTGILQALRLDESGKVPLSVINYVVHSKRQVVFDNISKDPTYYPDPYIKQRQTKSVVCFPILSKGELIAIIYLENNLVEGAFNPARLEILNMLSAQIAISVENTRLYDNLEEKVRQRTIALQKANRELEKNHIALAESHKKINDSVNYAGRIQEAVLPNKETLEKLLPGYFIFYRPCSVVSGDFYWVKQVGRHVIVAAADCTGHGVPGALVSMLGMAFLNEIAPQLVMQSCLSAANILNELRDKVKIAIKQRGELSGLKDGMDISLCIIDPASKHMQYAGAHNPLYMIREDQFFEVKADRMPVGISRKEGSFTNHEIPYHPGSMIYLFSDGYADQNREEDGGKFTRKRFKQLLMEINREPVSRQEEILGQRFDEWKGEQPQRDDVLIFGIRLT